MNPWYFRDLTTDPKVSFFTIPLQNKGPLRRPPRAFIYSSWHFPDGDGLAMNRLTTFVCARKGVSGIPPLPSSKRRGPRSSFPLIALLLSIFCLQTEAADEKLPARLVPIPRLECPLYVMGYHISYRSPFGHQPHPGYRNWGDTELADTQTTDADWMRQIRSVAYPLLGLYDSEERKIIRWQLRCARQAGIDGMFVQLFPDRAGTEFTETQIFQTILDLAAEEGVKVACHDEVMSRRNSSAQQPKAMAARASTFLRRFGSHPAYLKINGRSAYAFQFNNPFMNDEALASMLKKAETRAEQRPFWIVHANSASPIFAERDLGALVVTANSNFSKSESDFAGNKYGLLGSPTSSNAVQGEAKPPGHSRDEGKTLVDLLRKYSAAKPDFIMLSSWNDWLRSTAIEPGARFDEAPSSSIDPYLYCRILAEAKGRAFSPPPLPPKESVDPLRWQALYGVDRTPPQLVSVKVTGGKVHAIFRDSGRDVAGAVLAEKGDAEISFADLQPVANGLKVDGSSRLTGGSRTEFTLAKTAGNIENCFVAVEFKDERQGTLEIDYSALSSSIDQDGARSDGAGVEARADGRQTLRNPLKQSVKANKPFGQRGRSRFGGGVDARKSVEKALKQSLKTSKLFDYVAPQANIRLRGDGNLRAETRLLRSFDDPGGKIALRLDSARDLEKKQPLKIVRVRVFLSAQHSAHLDTGEKQPDGTRAFEWPAPSGQDFVYLRARDSENNWTAPIPVALK